MIFFVFFICAPFMDLSNLFLSDFFPSKWSCKVLCFKSNVIDPLQRFSSDLWSDWFWILSDSQYECEDILGFRGTKSISVTLDLVNLLMFLSFRTYSGKVFKVTLFSLGGFLLLPLLVIVFILESPINPEIFRWAQTGNRFKSASTDLKHQSTFTTFISSAKVTFECLDSKGLMLWITIMKTRD